MEITYYGHSCFQLHIAGCKILFDPFISGNPLAKDIDVHSIAADYIFISHAHFDHTADAIAIAQRTGATIVGVWEIHAWAERNGIKKTHPMNIGGIKDFEFGKVKVVNAVHSLQSALLSVCKCRPGEGSVWSYRLSLSLGSQDREKGGPLTRVKTLR